jgi:hypothetical protein
MSTTMVASEVKAVPPVVFSIQEIPLEKIRESKTNPRTQFDLDYFRRLDHDNHRRLSRLYAWEEKKSKTSWGTQLAIHEKVLLPRRAGEARAPQFKGTCRRDFQVGRTSSCHGSIRPTAYKPSNATACCST